MPLLESATRTARPARSAGAGLPQLVVVEARKAIDTRSGRAVLAVIAGLSAVVMIGISIFSARQGFLDVAGTLGTGMAPATILLPIVGILLVTAEWSQRTALVTFALVPERWRVLLAKVLATLLLAVVVLVVPLLVMLVTAGIAGGDPSVTVDYSGIGAAARVFGVSTGCAVLLGIGLAAVTLSAPLSIVLVLAIPLVFDTIVVRLPGGVGEYLASSTFPAWAAGTIEFAPSVITSLVLWYAVPLGLGFLRYLRTELS